MKTVISAGHGKLIRGARGNPVPPQLDEVDAARRVVKRVGELLGNQLVATYWDDVSRTQNENLKRITDFHNSKVRELDVSVHFNAYQNTTTKQMGTEVLWITQQTLAGKVSSALATALQLPNRGPKKRTDLYFLNNTAAPAILIETCFCDSTPDSNAFNARFEQACQAIATALGASAPVPPQPEPIPPEPSAPLFSAEGRCSWFGGPSDTGVSPSEGLAFIYSMDDAESIGLEHLFLPAQPPGTTGLARRLDAQGAYYVAVRWDYNKTPKEMLRTSGRMANVTANGRTLQAYPADWGPNENTGRIADLSPALMDELGLTTDDSVRVEYPGAAVEPPEPETDKPVVRIETEGDVTIIVNGVEI